MNKKLIVVFMFICCLCLLSSGGAIMMGGSQDSREPTRVPNSTNELPRDLNSKVDVGNKPGNNTLPIRVPNSTNELPRDLNSKVDVGNKPGNNTLPMSFAAYKDSDCTPGNTIQAMELNANTIQLNPANVSIFKGKPGSPVCCFKGTNVYITNAEAKFPKGLLSLNDITMGKEELKIKFKDDECTDNYEFKFRPSL